RSGRHQARLSRILANRRLRHQISGTGGADSREIRDREDPQGSPNTVQTVEEHVQPDARSGMSTNGALTSSIPSSSRIRASASPVADGLRRGFAKNSGSAPERGLVAGPHEQV